MPLVPLRVLLDHIARLVRIDRDVVQLVEVHVVLARVYNLHQLPFRRPDGPTRHARCLACLVVAAVLWAYASTSHDEPKARNVNLILACSMA